ALARSGSDEHRAEVIPALLAGELGATWAVSEPPPNDRLGAIATTAVADGDGFVLSGAKSPVRAAAQAREVLGTARPGHGLAQFLVPTDASGVTVKPIKSIDLTRRYARVDLDGVRVPASAAVGTPGAADADVERQLQLAIVMLTAECVGAAQRVFDFT